jgi:hypothetical protein
MEALTPTFLFFPRLFCKCKCSKNAAARMSRVRIPSRAYNKSSKITAFRVSEGLIFCQSENVKVFVKVLDFSMMLFMQGFYPHRH